MAFKDTLEQHNQVIDALKNQQVLIESLANTLIVQLKAGHKLLWAGNGGSAADAQHMAAEIVVRFHSNRMALPSIALTTDSSILTAAANDFGYDQVFSRQVEALGKAGDVLILLSTSGSSPNCIQAAKSAKALKIITVAMTGNNDSELSSIADWTIKVPSETTARIQEAHTVIAHYWCEQIEEAWLD